MSWADLIASVVVTVVYLLLNAAFDVGIYNPIVVQTIADVEVTTGGDLTTLGLMLNVVGVIILVAYPIDIAVHTPPYLLMAVVDSIVNWQTCDKRARGTTNGQSRRDGHGNGDMSLMGRRCGVRKTAVGQFIGAGVAVGGVY